MKKLLQDTYARGLEVHIVPLLSQRRKDTVQAVLEEQRECQQCQDSYETSSHCLREQSIAYSQLSKTFAVNMAECDHLDALQASMCQWTISPTTAAATATNDAGGGGGGTGACKKGRRFEV
jgi:hypothetical protein